MKHIHRAFSRMQHRMNRMAFLVGSPRALLMALLVVSAGMGAGMGRADAQTQPMVQTSQGWLQGVSRGDVDVFFGIPYAAPPVGDLRWRAPRPPSPWAGVRQAVLPASACMQAVARGSAEISSASEDCLYLNVHAPVATGEDGRLPVMVWLHGGAYVGGAGSNYDGTQLARVGKVIVVTLNYRLGVFGFLGTQALAAEDARGNHGLLDQQAALQWVKDNIGRFGGDASRVTLFGESAGGVSVCHQLASPSAQGLFHRAIIESGSCSDSLRTQATAWKSGKVLADRLACPEGDKQPACLRSRSASEVQAASLKLDLAHLEGPLVSTPFVDGVVLPEMSLARVKAGQIHRVPVLMGSNQDDGHMWVGSLYDYVLRTPLTEAAYRSQLSLLLGRQTAKALMSLYSVTRYGSANLALGAIVTDSMMACPTQRLARFFAAHVPTYVYEFQDRTVPPPAPDPFMDWGAFHSAEVGFLMRRAWGDAFVMRPEQQALSEQMMRYWSHFAATGQPASGPAGLSGQAGQTGQADWPVFKAPSWPVQRLKLNGVDTDRSRTVHGEHRCLIWDAVQALAEFTAAKP